MDNQEKIALRENRITAIIARAERMEKPFTPPLPFRFRPIDENGNRMVAMEYYNVFWRNIVEELNLYADDLRCIDRHLYNAMASAARREGTTINQIIPPSPTRGQVPEIRTLEEQWQRQRVNARERSRRARAKKSLSHLQQD